MGALSGSQKLRGWLLVLLGIYVSGVAPMSYPTRSQCAVCRCVAGVTWTADDPPISMLHGCTCKDHLHRDVNLTEGKKALKP